MGPLTQGLSAVSEHHCSTEELAALIDNGLSRADRRAVEAHLAGCTACRAEWVAARALASSSEVVSARSRFPAPAWWLGVAAVLTLLVIPVARRDGPADSTAPSTLRSAGIDGGSLRAITPREQALASPAGRLVWSDVGDATYRVVITDSSGASVWTATTRDTTAALPSGVKLARGLRYYWSVDALKADGSSYTTGAVPFSVRE